MNNLKKIKDNDLLQNFSHLVRKEKETTASLVRYLSEILRRRLFAREGYSSLFAYLTEKYYYSGSAAYRRIQAAKVSLKFPEIIDLLAHGKLNLVSISLIEPHLTFENGKELIEKVLGKTKEEIEYLISNSFQRAAIQTHADKIRRLPVIKKETSRMLKSCHSEREGLQPETQRISNGDSSSFATRGFGLRMTSSDAAAAVADENSGKDEIRRVKIEFVADERLAQKIERARAILRHKYPKARLEEIFDEALEVLLEKKDISRKLISRENERAVESCHPERQGREGSQRTDSSGFALGMTWPTPRVALARNDTCFENEKKKVTRYIPQQIRREVWQRDQGKCVYQSPEGKQCGEEAFLEMDHVRPWALGGRSTAENLQILCRTHNQYRAQQTFRLFR